MTTAKSKFVLTPEQMELSDKLTALQRSTVINVIKGMNYTEAYRKAGGKAKTDNSAYAAVSRLLSMVKVKAFHDSLIQQSAGDAIMTRTEALETLTKIARTTVKDVVKFRDAQVGEDENGNPVYQTVWQLVDYDNLDNGHAAAISELSTGRDGFKFKLHSQTVAIKQLSDLEGWDSPKKIEGDLRLSGNVDSPEVANALAALLDKL